MGISGRFHGQPRIRARTRDRRAHQQGRILLVVRENVVAPRFAKQLMRGNQHAAREAAPSRLRRESRTSDSREPPPDIVQDQCDPGIDAGGSLLSPLDNIDCSTFLGNFVSSPKRQHQRERFLLRPERRREGDYVENTCILWSRTVVYTVDPNGSR